MTMQRWLRLTDHRDVGTCSILFAVVAGLVGGVLSLALRLPAGSIGLPAGLSAWPAGMLPWQRLALQHGPIMVFFSAVPALTGGFGNWFVPLLVGAPNTAFPRLAALSFWLTVAGFVLTLVGLLGAVNPAWTLSLAVHLAAAATLLCGANLVTTILNQRRPDMSLGALPVFVWSQLIAGTLAVAALPMMAAALVMTHGPGPDMLASPAAARFLFYPGFCLMILPGLGLVSQIVATFCGGRLAGERIVVLALAALAMSGFLLWANQLLNGGVPAPASLFPLAALLSVLLPALLIAGCWTLTLWRAGGVRRLVAPGLFASGFIVVLVVGSLVALLREAGGASLAPLHDVLSLASVFALFAGFYYWIGKMTGKPYPERLARLQFVSLLAGVALLFGGLGAESPIAAAGASLVGVSMLLFALIVVITLRGARSVAANPWGAGAMTLEWSVPSPVPAGTFAEAALA
ncbi:cbb3-type cytochrome c oxidase subunit I [Lichenicola sp.]|uniref:cbb3-type cytochrome c oxidase subunit I n=1 Tax=Lichenicola sp. TaxID=2804529 RepID=UPI003B00FE38